MATDKEGTHRRVYVLPNELVERIVAYQSDMGFSSEVEAARRLLDDALKHRDDPLTIARRFQERLKETRMMADIAKDVLIGHPLVKSIGQETGIIQFTLVSGDGGEIWQDGTAHLKDKYGNVLHLTKDGEEDKDIPS